MTLHEGMHTHWDNRHMHPQLPVWQLGSTGLQALSRDPHLVWDSQGNFPRSDYWADSWWMKNNQLSFGEVNKKRKGFWRGERAHAKTPRSESVVGSQSKMKSKAIPGGSGVSLSVMNWMPGSAIEREERKKHTVLWLLNRSMPPPDFKTCFHMCLIPYWEGSIVLCSPGNAP